MHTIYSIVWPPCIPYEEFWLTNGESINPFSMFLLIFVLIGVLAVTEYVLSYFENRANKHGDMIVSSIIVVCVVSILYTFNINWDYISYKIDLDSYEYSQKELADRSIHKPYKVYNPKGYKRRMERCKKSKADINIKYSD